MFNDGGTKTRTYYLLTTIIKQAVWQRKGQNGQ